METDYNTFTVVQLKEIFKSRGVPTTGLSRKQQLIEKLQELDAENAQDEEETAHEEQPTEPENVTNQETPLDQEVTDVDDQAMSEVTTEAPPKADVAEPADAPKTEDLPTLDESKTKEKTADTPATENATDTKHDLPMTDAPESAPEPTPATIASNGQSPDVQVGLPTSESASVTSTSAPEESRKRKRRSPTPPPPAEEVALKRAKPNEYAPEVRLQEDIQGPVEPQREEKQEDSTREEATATQTTSPTLREPALPLKFRELPGLQIESNFGLDGAYANVTDIAYMDVLPSIHPATSALYLSGLVRPLNERSFKTGLLNHAKLRTVSESGEERAGSLTESEKAYYVDDSVEMTNFYMDTIRSHCFVVFNSVTAASRVRTCLHGQIYPKDGDRKPLSIDFVPPEKVEEWISQEKDAAEIAGSGLLRWEVAYDRADDGQVSAYLKQAQSVPAYNAKPSKAPSSPAFARRGSHAAPRTQAPPAQSPAFNTLNQAFNSTKVAKPMLYYLSVDEESISIRIDEMERELSIRYLRGHFRDVSHVGEKYVLEDDDRVYFDGADYRNAPYAPSGPRGGGGPRGRARGRWGGRY